MRNCELHDLGRMGYAQAFEVQRERVEKRKRGEIPDQLIFVEHPHVITMGRNGHDENLLASEEVLRRSGVEFHHSDRGGQYTFVVPSHDLVVVREVDNLVIFARGGIRVFSFTRNLDARLRGHDAVEDVVSLKRPACGN